MDSLHSIMDKRKKGTHLSLEERVIIQTRLKDHCSLRSIAREIGCSPSTIHYEIKRGTVKLYHGNIKRYKAQQGQSVYQNHRQHCAALLWVNLPAAILSAPGRFIIMSIKVC